MRITVTVPDEIGEALRRRTDDASAYVRTLLRERLGEEQHQQQGEAHEKRRTARRRLLDMAGGGDVDPDIHETIRRERREGDRSFDEEKNRMC